MKTHDKKWAIQQMLDGKIVQIVPEYSFHDPVECRRYFYDSGAFCHCYYKNGKPQELVNEIVNINDIQTLNHSGYILYEEPEKVELPANYFCGELEAWADQLDDGDRDFDYRLKNITLGILERQNHIMKYLKMKENK